MTDIFDKDMMAGDDLMEPAQKVTGGGRRHTGPLALWCDSCGAFKRADRLIKGCPDCGGMMWYMRCTRCGHTWAPKDPTRMPGLCPACKSPYFARPRMGETVDAVNRRMGVPQKPAEGTIDLEAGL